MMVVMAFYLRAIAVGIYLRVIDPNTKPTYHYTWYTALTHQSSGDAAQRDVPADMPVSAASLPRQGRG
jgi:hypothetical protein